VLPHGQADQQVSPTNDIPHAHPIAPSHFELREDGSIQSTAPVGRDSVEPKSISRSESQGSRDFRPTIPNLIFSSDNPFIRLYHGNCLELLDAIAAKYPEGRFDAIFADPPYFLSNGGITCHAGKMVKVDKGDWDVSRGPELNHEFNTEWLRRCQKVLKPNGTIWVTGTHHVIFSIGYALQQLGFKILNDIAWEKPNPPPNLSCRYFTHSTETVLWAAKNEKSKHVFNYQEMRKVTGKQMKTVWRKEEFEQPSNQATKEENEKLSSFVPSLLNPIWTMGAPSSGEKVHGKHPTQKPIALVERCLLASTNEGDLVLDPFLGGATTAIVSLRLKRGCVGVEMDIVHLNLARRRVDQEIIEIWLRHFRVRIDVSVTGRAELPLRHASRPTPHASPQIDLAIFPDSINGSRRMAGVPEIQTERIFHECKFVFLSCAQVERGAVVHTTVDVSLQEAWAKTPTGKKRETTHVVRCETEILRVKSNS
jgi:site-specific DNA-methyltransferase (adenine-specific)